MDRSRLGRTCRHHALFGVLALVGVFTNKQLSTALVGVFTNKQSNTALVGVFTNKTIVHLHNVFSPHRHSPKSLIPIMNCIASSLRNELDFSPQRPCHSY